MSHTKISTLTGMPLTKQPPTKRCLIGKGAQAKRIKLAKLKGLPAGKISLAPVNLGNPND